MRTHPGVEAIAKASGSSGASSLEGYLEVKDGQPVRLHSSLEGGVIWELDPSSVLYEHEIEGSNGKSRVYVDAEIPAKLTVTLIWNDHTSGTACRGGTQICWDRYGPLADGSYIIIAIPCGSCLGGDTSGDAGVFEAI
jgi:hypothetical protein